MRRMTNENEQPEARLPLVGERVGILGKLASMSRTDAARMCRRAGGLLVHPVDATVTLLVQGEQHDASPLSDELTTEICQAGVHITDETTLLDRVGLVDSGRDVSRLYTPAMLAGVLDVPLAALRRWIRKGYLLPACEVRRLAYFDFPEVAIGRRLADLLHHGASLATIDKKLAEFERQLPDVPRPLAELAVVVEGGNLFLQRDGAMAEASGQRLFAFDDDDVPEENEEAERLHVISLDLPDDEAIDPDSLRVEALELADQGNIAQAIELYRAVMLSGDADADDHFSLAELLYQSGQPLAARERYYMAIECDEDLIEARVNLGVLLGELGETELALSALSGAIDQHPGFADAHYHLARLLEQQKSSDEATEHWQRFLELTPESPWADEARGSLET